ncbi:MAG TPA: CBS domain-containing protein [Solirubrobacteraceae bacterium]|jgi:Mg/Co/Ni transporter MgtE|nr:CBS domain-containing protein [Solirubrobacteraceae bacterium]
MSARAACRLAGLGFEHVYDYMPGKLDWLARGLPVEGDQNPVPRVKDVVRDDAVRARLDEPVGEVRPRVEHSPYGFALVVSEDGTLLGRLRKRTLEGDPDATSEQVMEPGPSTVRLDTDAGKLAERLDQRDLETAVVTDPDGRLVGVARLADLRSARSPEQR